MGLMPGRGETAIDLMNRLLDRGYVQASGAVLQAITRNSTTGLMARRFEELEREAARLAAEGARLTLDNAVVRAFMADFEDTMRANQALLNSAAGAVQQTGIDAAGPIARQMALPGFTDEMLRAMGIAWNVPNPEAVARLVNYASSDAWAGLVGKYGDDAVAVVKAVAVRGALEGWGPVRTAREMRRMVEGIPPNTANTLMRTLQLTSLRDAQVVHRVSNAEILQEQIRIAALDASCCVACVALHGTRLPINARIDDHHNGRCLVPGQMVETARGAVPVEQVEVGDLVLTHKGRWQPVIGRYQRPYSGDVVQVVAGGESVTVTPEHQLLSDGEWVEARALSADSTLATLYSSDVRVSRRRTDQPSAVSRSSFLASAGRLAGELCQRGSSSTASISSGKAKSMLKDSTANCGIGTKPALVSTVRKCASYSVRFSRQLTCRLSARFLNASGDEPFRAIRALNSGSDAIWRNTAALALIGSMLYLRMSFMSVLVLIASWLVISRYVACSSTYLRLSQSPIGSPTRAVSAASNRALRDSLPLDSRPSTFKRRNTPILERPGNSSAISRVPSSLHFWRSTSSSSGVQYLPTIGVSSIATIIHQTPVNAMHKRYYSGVVYDLEVAQDHSFIAGGVVVHNCTSITVLKGRPAPNVQSGEAWFAQRSEAQQRAQMGDAAFEAWRAGRVQLREFAVRTEDPVFGGMIQEASLKGILGSGAREFYGVG